MIFEEPTPCPAGIPDNRDEYDLLRVWLEMNMRGLFAMARGIQDTLDWGDLTEGSIVFVDSEGGLTEDNANLFFDDTNNRVGIGTNSPATTLEVLNASTAQFRLTHTAASKYVDFTLDTNSDLLIKPTSTFYGPDKTPAHYRLNGLLSGSRRRRRNARSQCRCD
jgi:hypothetical protein